MENLVNWQALIIQTINISIVIFVLWKFFFKPYLAFLDVEASQRTQLEKDIKNSAHIVENAQMEAKKILDDSRLDAKNMANDILDNARNEADAIMQQANTDAELARKQGFADIEHERKNLREEMKQKVLSVALKMNEKLFGKNDANEQFLKNTHKDINF